MIYNAVLFWVHLRYLVLDGYKNVYQNQLTGSFSGIPNDEKNHAFSFFFHKKQKRFDLICHFSEIRLISMNGFVLKGVLCGLRLILLNGYCHNRYGSCRSRS